MLVRHLAALCITAAGPLYSSFQVPDLGMVGGFHFRESGYLARITAGRAEKNRSLVSTYA